MKQVAKYLKHLFIPHERNNFRAKALHIDFLSFYLLLSLFLTFGFKILASKSGGVLGFATDITVDKLYQLTNNIRLQNQLSNLTYNQNLADAAEKKASDMFAKNYWSHYASDGKTPWDFILSSNYQYEVAGENLAKNFLFSQGVVDAWLDSPSHRENILREDYVDVGFAIVNGILNGEETTIVVQMLGKPLNSALAKETGPLNKVQIPAKTVEAESYTSPTSKSPNPQTVLVAQNAKPQRKSLGKFSFGNSLIFLVFFFFALTADFYFASKLHVVRISGKSVAHLVFISFIFLGLLILTQGSIL